jgi:hypothetical protein
MWTINERIHCIWKNKKMIRGELEMLFGNKKPTYTLETNGSIYEDEVLKMIEDYYVNQKLPDYKSRGWEDVSSEIYSNRPRRFL